MSRKNYYLLLDLDVFNVLEDEEALLTHINKKKAEWSKLRNHPSRSTEAREKLALVNDMVAVFTKEDSRKREIEEAINLVNEEKLAKEKEVFESLDNMIRILSSRGWIYEHEATDMAKTFGLAETAVRSRISHPIKKASGNKKEEKKKVDVSKAKQIADLCGTIGIVSPHPSGVPSIYDFLQESPMASSETLIAKADEKYVELSRKKRDAKIEYETKLQSYCKSILQREREEYDRALTLLRLEILEKPLAIACSTGKMDTIVFEQFIQEGMNLGIQQKEVSGFVKEYCTKHHVTIGNGEKSAVLTPLKQCGKCGLVNKDRNKHCTRCSSPLELECPSCKKVSPSSTHACGDCGFVLGDIFAINEMMRKANFHSSLEEWKEAEYLYQRVLSIWKNHREAKRCLQVIGRRKNELEEKISSILEMMENKQYYTARSELIKLKIGSQAEFPFQNLDEECRDRIHSAESLLRRARGIQDEKQAIQYYMRALEVAADCKEANEMIEKWPPDAPKSIQVMTISSQLHLKWDLSASPGTIHYRVVRKKDHPVEHSSDGEIVQEGPSCTFIDTSAIGGHAYYYSIFSVRGKSISENGMLQGPILLRPDVQDVVIHQEDTMIEMKWKAPKGATSVEVWRKEGEIPKGRNDGVKLENVSLKGMKDDTVVFGKKYGFLIVVTFPGGNDTVYSEGISQFSKAIRMPKPIGALYMKREVGGVTITVPETDERIQVFYSTKPFPFKKGEVCAPEKMAELGDKVELSAKNTGFAKVNLKKPVYFIPVSYNEEAAVFGEMVVSKVHPEVSGIFHKVEKDSLVIQWDWPEEISRVIVAYRKDSFPIAHDDPNASKIQIAKGSYQVLKGYKIPGHEQNYFITIYTVYEENDKEVYSNGADYLCMNTKPVDISYEISASSFFKKKLKLSLYTDTAVTLPGLVLVKKEGGLPMHRNDGKEIFRIMDHPEVKGTFSETIPQENFEKNYYAKLFFINEKEAPKVRLQTMGGKDALKLF